MNRLLVKIKKCWKKWSKMETSFNHDFRTNSINEISYQFIKSFPLLVIGFMIEIQFISIFGFGKIFVSLVIILFYMLIVKVIFICANSLFDKLVQKKKSPEIVSIRIIAKKDFMNENGMVVYKANEEMYQFTCLLDSDDDLLFEIVRERNQ